MANCLENNYTKIELVSSLLFKVDGDKAIVPVLENAMKELDIDSPKSFLTYILKQSKDNPDISGFVLKLFTTAVKAGVNPLTFTDTLISGATDVYQRLSIEKASISTETALQKADIGPTTTITEIDETSPDTTTGQDIDESVPPEGNVHKVKGVKTLVNLHKQMLLGDLIRNPNLLKNTFKKLISRNWLSTRSDTSVLDNFDNKKIRGNIKKDAKDIITDYYKKSAEATTSLGGSSNVLFFSSKGRLPNGANLQRGNNQNGSYTTSAGNTLTFYKYEYTNDNDVVYVLSDNISGISMEEVHEGMNHVLSTDLVLDPETQIEPTPIMEMDEALRPIQVNKITASENIQNKGLLDAYFSILIINNLDTFISDISPELDSTIAEKKRTGSVRTDVIGSNMETKMLRLGITSTPKIMGKSDNTKTRTTIATLRSKVNEEGGTTIAKKLYELEIIKTIDNQGHNIFTYELDGKVYENVVIDIGGTNLVFSYDYETQRWGIQYAIDDAGIQMFNSGTAISTYLEDSKIKVSDDFEVGVNKVLLLLNNIKNDFDTFSTSINNSIVKTSPEAIDLISTTNNNSSLSITEDTVNVSILNNENEDGFLRTADTILAAGILANLPHDMDEAATYLLDAAEGSGSAANVARSLYYKFFHPGEYTITEISPITGMVESVTHMSIYEKALRYNDKVAWEALLSLQTQLSSTVIDNKVFLGNGQLIKSAIQNSDSIDYLVASVDYEGTESIHKGHKAIQDDELKNKFRIAKSTYGNPVIKFYEHGYTAHAIPTVEFSVSNVSIDIKSGRLNHDIISKMLTLLKAPVTVRSINLYDSLKITYKEEKNPKLALDAFYGKLIALRLANVVDSKGKSPFETNMIPNPDKLVRYTFNDNMTHNKEALADGLSRLHTRAFSATYMGPKGTKFSVSIYKNLSKDKPDIIAKLIKNFMELPDSYMYKDSAFLDSSIMEIKESLTRLGMKVGLVGKDTSELNQQELATALVSTFIQHAAQVDFREGMSTEGTMSDRAKIDMFIVKLMDEYGDIAPHYIEDGEKYLDELKLRGRFFDSQKRSFNGLQNSIVSSWKNVLSTLPERTIEHVEISEEIAFKIENMSSLRDVHDILNSLELDYAQTLLESGLVDNYSIIKKQIHDKQGRKKTIASINYSMVQLSEIMLAKDTDKKAMDKKNFYLDMYYNEFMEYMDEIGYQISPQEIRGLEKRFEWLSKEKKEKGPIARELALKLYFYNESVIENELAQFGMGSVFQYHKSRNIPMFEVMNNDRKVGPNASDTKKLNFIKKYKFKGGLTVKDSLEKLNNLGEESNEILAIKGIVDSNLAQKDKLKLIEYLDIFSQISPMYVDRVKRNQANGTSGMNPILASENKAGVLLDKVTKTLLLEDPTGTIFALNSGDTKVDSYDGAQLASPSYYYKINRSLGNKFSNFRSTSFLKSMNASKTEEGVSMYEKSATFSLFNWEVLTNGTAEHHSLHEVMMDKEKFLNHDATFDGLYLLDKKYLLNPESAPFTETLTIDDVFKHGEYLGKLQVSIQDEPIGEPMEASYLLYAIERGMIDAKSVLGIKTNKTLVPEINSKLDLYNYYGGPETNLLIINANDDATYKQDTMDEFPFGWVEYEMVNIMSNYRGSNHNYPIRNAEINKVEFSSTVKTGRKNVNPSSVISNKDLTVNDIITSDVSNDQLYIILQAEHGFDVTKRQSLTASEENNSIAMMTQTNSNAAMEGDTMEDVNYMESALANLSDLQLVRLQEEIDAFSVRVDDKVNHDTAQRQYSTELLRKVLPTRGNSETAQEIIGETAEDSRNVAFDLQMIQPILRSTVNAEFNRRAIKTRFPGGQYVVSPVTYQMKTYGYGGAKGLIRNSINNYSKRKISDYSINGLLKQEITSDGFSGVLSDTTWSLQTVPTVEQLKAQHNSLDYVYDSKTFSPIRVSTLISKHSTIQQKAKLATDLKNGKYVSPWLDTESTNDPIIASKIRTLQTKVEQDLKEIGLLQNYGADKASDIVPLMVQTAQEEGRELTIEELNAIQTLGDVSTLPNGGDTFIEDTINHLTQLIAIKFNRDKGLLTSGLKQNSNGDELQWMQYFQDGISLYETEEFHSYYLAGKSPKELSKLESVEEKLDFFKKEMKSKDYKVPTFLWARFMNQLQEDAIDGDIDPEFADYVTTLKGNGTLTASTVLGTASVTEAYGDFTTAISDLTNTNNRVLLDSFFNYLQDFEGEEKYLSNMFRTQIEYKLEEDGWEFKESEFFMPPQHMSAFLITYGDNIQDIVGLQEQPDLVILASILRLSEEEKIILERNYVYGESDEVVNILTKIKASEHPEAAKYLKLRKEQQEHMLDYFGSKITSIEKSIDKASKKEIEAIKERAPLLLLKNILNKKNTPVEDIQKLIDDLLNRSSILENSELMNTLHDIQLLLTESNLIKAREVINSASDLFVTNWKTTLSDNFEKSLTFITSRIPSQAKQQTTIGKIKNFVYSTKNAIYTPIELIALSGADYDIDKQNNMTWNVDSMGKIVDWRGIVGDGVKDDMDSLVLDLEIKLKDLGYTPEQIFEKTIKFKQARLEHVSQAVQNFVVHKLMRVSGSAKNAIEAATVTAMTKLGVVKDYMSSFKVSEKDVAEYGLETVSSTNKKTGKIEKRYKPNKALFDLISKRQLAIPYSPSTKMLYEKVNMDGKMGIAIFASAIKAYTTIFKAALNNTGVKNYQEKLDGKLQLDKAFTDIKGLNASLTSEADGSDQLKYIKFKAMGTNKPLKLVWKNPSTGMYEESKDLEYPANTQKFISKTDGGYPALNTRLAKDAYKKIKTAATPMEEATEILKYKEYLDKDRSLRDSGQAWEDLSELLTASTDNAKEMVLSAIGANNTTSSIIATMVVMGLDLHSILLVINDPIIRKVVKEFENSKTLINNKTDFITSFKDRLGALIPSYNKEMSEEEVSNLRKKLEDSKKYTKEEVDEQVEKQEELHARYNPAKQMQWFNEATSEFMELGGVLKINTGMVNSEVDTFNYLFKVERALKIYGGKKGLKDFLENKSDRQVMIDEANENKVAFNIPYIIFSNKVFFNHLKTMYESNEMMKNLTYTTDILHTNIKPMMFKARRAKLEKADMFDYNNLLANIAISTYYTKNKTKLVIPNFRTFDLAKADDRLEFIQNIGKIKNILTGSDENLVNNIVVKDLQANNVQVDFETGKTITLLDGINTVINDEGIIAGYQTAMTALKEDSKELYDVLFHYSLIIDKAALRKSSLAILFGFDPYRDFNDHVLNLKVSGNMQRIIQSMNPDILGLSLPIILKEFSTLAGFKNSTLITKYNSTDTDDETTAEIEEEKENAKANMADSISVEWDFMSDEDFERISSNKSMSTLFDVTDMNKMLAKENNAFKIFKSKTNGLTYMVFKWTGDNPLHSYIPITKNITSTVGNVDITERISEENINQDYISDVGYGFGWEILLEDGTTGRLLAHHQNIDKAGMYYVLTDADSERPNMILVPGKTIMASNPQFQLHMNYIRVKKGGFKAPKEPAVFYDSKGNKVKKGTPGAIGYPIDASTEYVKGTHKLIYKYILDKGILLDSMTPVNAVNKKSKLTLSEFLPNSTRPEGNNDEQIDNYFNYIYSLLITNSSAIYKIIGDKIQNEKTIVRFLEEVLGTPEANALANPDIKAVHDFLQDLKNDENREILFTFLRKSDEDKFKYLESEVLGGEKIIPRGVKLNPKHFKNNNLRENYKSAMDLINKFSSKGTLPIDIEFLDKENFNHLTVKDYVSLLKNVGITMPRFRSLKKIDVLSIDNKISIEPRKSSSVKKSIPLDTSRSALYKKSKIQAISPKVTSRLTSFLNKRFENSTVKLLSVGDIQAQYPDVDISNKDQAFVNIGNNTIVLIKERATLDTLLHEMGHLYLANLKDKDLALYESLMEKMQDSGLLPDIIKKYSDNNNYTKEDVLEEAFVITLHDLYSNDFMNQFQVESEEQFDGILDKGGKPMGNITTFYSEVFHEAYDVKANKNTQINMNDSIMDIMKKIGIDIIFNKNSVLGSMSRNDISNLKTILRNNNMTEGEAEQFLIDKGLINKFCK